MPASWQPIECINVIQRYFIWAMVGAYVFAAVALQIGLWIVHRFLSAWPCGGGHAHCGGVTRLGAKANANPALSLGLVLLTTALSSLCPPWFLMW